MGNNKSLFARLSPDGSDIIPAWLINVLELSDFPDRARIIGLSRNYRAFTHSDRFWRFLTIRLSIERGIYVPAVLAPSDRTWRLLFRELHSSLRNMWINTSTNVASQVKEHGEIEDVLEDTAPVVSTKQQPTTEERFKISVFARFRPVPAAAANTASAGSKKVDATTSIITDEDDENTSAVVLPLHQRLSMIRLSGKAGNNREALRVLATEGEWFQAKWSRLQTRENEEKENGKDNEANSNSSSFLLDADTKLSLRPGEQPFSVVKAKAEKTIARVQSLDTGSGRVVMLAPDVGLREFSFDGVLPLACTQQRVYETTTMRLVRDFVNGYNATAIAYGQTGSGKTHTMFGPPTPNNAMHLQVDRGIIPRACQEVLAAISQPQRADKGITASIAVSYVEIFGDLVTDLLQHGQRVGHSKVAAQRFVLSGAAEKPVSNLDDVYSALIQGENHKRRASTAMNDRSSRAHSLFILTLNQTCTTTGVSRQSRLFLADLGGSEQVKKSKVDAGGHRAGVEEQFSAGFNMGTQMREAVYINLGLLALKKVIESLNLKAGYCPYQDSKLTMLLSAGLGGNSKTSIIVCGSMDPRHASETVSSLRFGERCSLVENAGRNNANMLASVLRELDRSIAELEATIKDKERWEVLEEVRVDALAEKDTVEAAVGGKEVKKISQLVGAEAERKALEGLLRRRAEFTGSDLDGDSFASAGAAGHDGPSRASKKKVVGFGAKSFFYGLGEAYNADEDFNTNNARFSDKVSVEELSSVVRAKGGKGWTRPEDLESDPAKLEAKAKKANRSKLVYSGLSA